MQSRNKLFLQKLKNNAFYIALGIGLLAILAVVAVYTMEHNGIQVAENEIDLNQASDYSVISNRENEVKETNGQTVSQAGASERTSEMITESVITTEREEVTTEIKEEETVEGDLAEEDPTEENEEQAKLPVISDAGELNFNSDKTITWPVNGEILLPYSMETTVYFKTLDQYRCNPGMLIGALGGTTVQNAYLGKVTKVTSDNTYGNMVTMYIGNDYSIVYGQLDMIYVKEGDYVKAGEPIGTVGNPTDIFQKEGSHLFFQMLEGDTPVDPALYIE